MEPLTLDKLQEMDGLPVWLGSGPEPKWCLVHVRVKCEDDSVVTAVDARGTFLNVGKWIKSGARFYREKPVEAEPGNGLPDGGRRMNNGNRIRSMSDMELAFFLYAWQCNFLAEVLQNGFARTMNFTNIQDWIAAPAKPHPIFEKWEGDG